MWNNMSMNQSENLTQVHDPLRSRPSYAEAKAFARDIFGVEEPTMDVIPHLADLSWLRERGEYFKDVRVAKIGRERECYKSASKFTATIPGSQYVQGFVLSDGVIYGHAWCVHPDGTALEVSWPEAEGVYFGVRLSHRQLSRLHMKYENYDWYEGIATSGCLS